MAIKCIKAKVTPAEVFSYILVEFIDVGEVIQGNNFVEEVVAA